jgi:hypothetical protein
VQVQVSARLRGNPVDLPEEEEPAPQLARRLAPWAGR